MNGSSLSKHSVDRDDDLHRQWTAMMKSNEASSKLLHLLSRPSNGTVVNDLSRAINSIMDSVNYEPLNLDQVNNVEKFVLFIGYPRSGHSIIGTMIDSHPNIIIANEFPLMASLLTPASRNGVTKLGLFNALYLNSRAEMVYGKRGKYGLERKGYLLNTNSSYQGKFSKLKVIGDKKGGQATKEYHRNPDRVRDAFKWLQTEVGVPICVLHVVRNPYDMIATQTLYLAGEDGHKYEASEANKLNNSSLVESAAEQFIFRAKALVRMTAVLHLNILLIRHEDMVSNPKQTMSKICTFLQVNCTDDYLDVCREKVDPSLSKSRHLIVWTSHLRDKVDSLIKQFNFFNGYTLI